MRFVDFALQGFLDLQGAAQVRFGSALTAVGTQPVRAETLARAILEAIFAEGYDPASVRLAAAGARSTRAVITFQSADESVFRLVRDIVRGSAQLLRYESDSRDFVPVATDAIEIAQFLRGRVGVPSRDIFTQAFVVRAGDLPSQQAAVASAPVARSAPAGAPRPLSEQDRAQRKQRLEQLRRALAAHENVQALEYELDGLQKRRFDLEDQLARRDMDSTAVDEARERYQKLRYLEALPDDFSLKVEYYHDAVARRAQELERWEREREELERISRALSVEPIARDWRLWTGLVGGAAALACGFVLDGPLRLAALADIPAFGLSAFVLWQHLSSLELRDNNRRKLKLSDRRKELIETRDESEIRDVEAATAQLGHRDVDELVRHWEGLTVAKAELESAQREYQRVQNDPELHHMKVEYAELRERIGALETQLASSSLGGEAQRVREEIEEIERELTGEHPSVPSPPSAVAATPTLDVTSGPLKAFLVSAAELLLVSSEEAAERVSAATTPILTHLSSNQLRGIRLTLHGELNVVSESGTPRPLLALPPATQDVAYLAMRAGLLSVLQERMRAPLVLCDLEQAVPAGMAFVIAYASLVAQHNQTICLGPSVSEGWPEGTTIAPLVFG